MLSRRSISATSIDHSPTTRIAKAGRGAKPLQANALEKLDPQDDERRASEYDVKQRYLPPQMRELRLDEGEIISHSIFVFANPGRRRLGRAEE
jgi:hypothetical protein